MKSYFTVFESMKSDKKNIRPERSNTFQKFAEINESYK